MPKNIRDGLIFIRTHNIIIEKDKTQSKKDSKDGVVEFPQYKDRPPRV